MAVVVAGAAVLGGGEAKIGGEATTGSKLNDATRVLTQAKALLERGEEIGLATVYRVLTQFVNAGLAERHHFEGGQAVFELDRGHHHDHIVCEQCGRVEEFFDETIEKCQSEIASRKGFSITDHSLIIYGRCTRENCPHKD